MIFILFFFFVIFADLQCKFVINILGYFMLLFCQFMILTPPSFDTVCYLLPQFPMQIFKIFLVVDIMVVLLCFSSFAILLFVMLLYILFWINFFTLNRNFYYFLFLFLRYNLYLHFYRNKEARTGIILKHWLLYDHRR